jgi:hypothetical protein
MIFYAIAVQGIEFLDGNLVAVDALQLIDYDLKHTVVQLRHALDPNIRSFGKSIGDSLVGIPSHRRDDPGPVLELQQQVRATLSIGSELTICDSKNRIDLGLRLQVGNILTLRRV